MRLKISDFVATGLYMAYIFDRPHYVIVVHFSMKFKTKNKYMFVVRKLREFTVEMQS